MTAHNLAREQQAEIKSVLHHIEQKNNFQQELTGKRNPVKKIGNVTVSEILCTFAHSSCVSLECKEVHKAADALVKKSEQKASCSSIGGGGGGGQGVAKLDGPNEAFQGSPSYTGSL